MKLTYCGIAPTSINVFGAKTKIERNDVTEMEEKDALQLLNSYSNVFAPTLNKDAVKALIQLNDDKEEVRQKMIDTEIAEKLIKEENARKEKLAILERKAKEVELKNKEIILKSDREIKNIETALKNEEAKKIELKIQMEEDKAIMDKRIAEVKKTLKTNK